MGPDDEEEEEEEEEGEARGETEAEDDRVLSIFEGETDRICVGLSVCLMGSAGVLRKRDWAKTEEDLQSS